MSERKGDGDIGKTRENMWERKRERRAGEQERGNRVSLDELTINSWYHRRRILVRVFPLKRGIFQYSEYFSVIYNISFQ